MTDRPRPAREAARLELLRAAELWFWRMSQAHDIRNWTLVEEWNRLQTFAKIRRFMAEVRAGHPFAVEEWEKTKQGTGDVDVAEIPPEQNGTAKAEAIARKVTAQHNRAAYRRRRGS